MIGKVTIYGKENCVWCERAVELCESKKIQFKYKKIEDLETRDILLKLLPDVKTVPQIWDGGTHIGGYTEFAEYIEGQKIL